MAMQISDPTPDAISRAAEVLKTGDLVAFPTETVYGLGADATNEAAVRKIFAAKGRPADHPLIVHVAAASQLEPLTQNVPPAALALADAFWPGPLTLILERSSTVSNSVTGGQNTVGVRVPGHPVALALLEAFGGPVAAPSANKFGRISPTRAEHVVEEMGESVAIVLDGGQCEVGVESTIVDLSSGVARVLRPGGVTLQALAEILGYTPDLMEKSLVRASGTLDSHYAPTTPSFLVGAQQLDNLARTAPAQTGFVSQRLKPAWVQGVWHSLPAEPETYAQTLYATLRELDGLELEKIYVEVVAETDAWLAVRDRLRRATTSVTLPEAAEVASR